MSGITLAIIEDDPLIRESLMSYLHAQPEIDAVLTAESIEQFLMLLNNAFPPTTILLDIGLPGMSGIQGIPEIKNRLPEVDIIMLTAMDDQDHLFQALQAGAVSYLSKRSRLETIREAILIVHKGGSFISPSIARHMVNYFAKVNPSAKKEPTKHDLTPRQWDIINGLVEALSYKLIADKYDISVETVRDHIKNIYKKLQVNSRNEVVKLKMDGKL